MLPQSLPRAEPDKPPQTAAPVPDPLVMGTTLLDRYTVIEFLKSDSDANVYRVAELRACLHCGVENEGNLERCGFCGTELPIPHMLVLVERPTPVNGERLPTSFVLSGMTYAFASNAEQNPNSPRRAPAWDYAYLTDPGIARALRGDPNEDSVLALRMSFQHTNITQDLGILMIADGVGGAAAGEVASEMATRTIAQELIAALVAPASNEDLGGGRLRDILCAAIGQANRQLIEYGVRHSVSPGTTIVLALLYGGRLYVANVGDSRAYLFSRQTLTQLTHDHSFVAALMKKGEITADQARAHPQRNLILKSLGDPTGFDVDVFPAEADGIELCAGDKLLLCSDGLWELVDDEAIARILAEPFDAAQACAQLVSFANAAGGMDNISVLIAQMEGAR